MQHAYSVKLWFCSITCKPVMYNSGLVERLSLEITATDGNCKILLLSFSKAVMFVFFFFLYEASEHSENFSYLF
jgi:hypothetical protein